MSTAAKPTSPNHPTHGPQGGRMLRYRPWRGTLSGPARSIWAIARTALGLMFRRKVFWGFYGFAVLIFLVYFFAQYLSAFVASQLGSEPITIGSGYSRVTLTPADAVQIFEKRNLNGSGLTFANFIWSEGFTVMVVLAFAGAMLIGNDFQHRSLPFYLAKPISRWHYLAGKCLAIGVFVNLATTVPALVLFVQYGLLKDDWNYFVDSWPLLLGILGYGLLLTVTLSLILAATATWLQKTVPLVMVWTAMFAMCRGMSRWLVDELKFDPSWRLIDLWNNLYLLGTGLLSVPHREVKPDPQPQYWEAALVVGAVCLACLIYLRRRIRAVEVFD